MTVKKNPASISPFEVLLKTNTRFKIWAQLNLYRELSLAQLAKNLKKSKSTIHDHLHKLLEVNLVVETREEPSRGWIPTKFYGINENWSEIFLATPEMSNYSNIDGLDEALRIIRLKKALIRANQTFLDLKMRFMDYLEELMHKEDINVQQSSLDLYNHLKASAEKIDAGKASDWPDTNVFLTEEIYYDFIIQYMRLVSKYERKNEEFLKSHPKLTNNFFFLGNALPLKKIFEVMQKEE